MATNAERQRKWREAQKKRLQEAQFLKENNEKYWKEFFAAVDQRVAERLEDMDERQLREVFRAMSRGRQRAFRKLIDEGAAGGETLDDPFIASRFIQQVSYLSLILGPIARVASDDHEGSCWVLNNEGKTSVFITGIHTDEVKVEAVYDLPLDEDEADLIDRVEADCADAGIPFLRSEIQSETKP